MEPRASHYQILGLLADGGMAEICLARDRRDGRQVALKRIKRPFDADPEYVEMFRDECRVWARLRHPNVVRLLEHGSDDEGPFLAMELVDGTDLGAVLQARRGQPLPLGFALAVAGALFDALAYLHAVEDEAGCTLCLVHRDVSPGNLLCGADGAVKLTDFGVVQVLVKTHKTRVGDLKGKFAYMSPEQTRGEALSPASDLFSAGVVLWEMLAGRPLFDRDTDLDTVQAVRDAEVPALATLRDDVPAPLDALLAQLLARDAAARPVSAEAVAAQLRRLARDHGIVPGEVAVREVVAQVLGDGRALEDRLRPAPRRRTLVAARPDRPVARSWRLAGLLGASLLVLALALLWRDQAPGAVTPERASTDAGTAGAALARVVSADAGPPAPPAVVDASQERDATARSPRVDAGPGRATVRRPLPPPLRGRPDAAAGFGWLDLNAEPWAQIAVDGVSIQRHTPLRDFALPAGRHRITLHNPVFELTRTIQVEIRAGERVQRAVDLTAP